MQIVFTKKLEKYTYDTAQYIDMEFPIRNNNKIEYVWINQNTINNSKHLVKFLEYKQFYMATLELNLGGVPYDYFIAMVRLENDTELNTIINSLKNENNKPMGILYKLLKYSDFFYFDKISAIIKQYIQNLEKNKKYDIDLKTELQYLYLVCDKLILHKSFRKILSAIINSKQLNSQPFNIRDNVYIGYSYEYTSYESACEDQFKTTLDELTVNIFKDLKNLNIYIKGEFLYEILRKKKPESEINIYMYGANIENTEKELTEYFKSKNFTVCKLTNSYKIYKNNFDYIININYSCSNKTTEFIIYTDLAIEQIVYIPKTEECFCTQKFIFLMLTTYEVNPLFEIRHKCDKNYILVNEKNIDLVIPKKIIKKKLTITEKIELLKFYTELFPTVNRITSNLEEISTFKQYGNLLVPLSKTQTTLYIEKEERIKLEISNKENISFAEFDKINMFFKYKKLLFSNKIRIKKIKLESFDDRDKLIILKKINTNSKTIINVDAKIRYVIFLEKNNEYHLIGYPELSNTIVN